MAIRLALTLAVVVMSAAWPTNARAFICTRVQDGSGAETGPALAWFTRSLHFTLFGLGTNTVPGDGERDVLRASFIPWGRLIDANGVVQGTPPVEAVPPFRTTDLTFTEVGTPSNRDRVGYDFLVPDANENLLIFRDDGWPNPAQAGSIIALTTTTYNALTGEIFDADIEFNSAGFDFSITDSVPSGETDLKNTAVHEIGHYLGLGHSPVVASTMHDKAGDREVSKRTLHEDDRNGIVFKYPAGDDNGYSDSRGCPPPGVLTGVPTITVSSSDGDLTSRTCTSTGVTPLLALAILALLAPPRRRSW